MTGDELVRVFAALANPHRLRIVALLSNERLHISQLARQVNLSRPLVHMHLRKLEEAGLVTGELVVSDEGRAMRFMEATAFALEVTPQVIRRAAATLSDGDGETSSNKERQE